MSNEKSVSGGIGFTGVLSIVFIVLKLCDVIDWSWWWVLSPIWIPVLVLVAFGIIFLIIWIILKKIDGSRDWRKNIPFK